MSRAVFYCGSAGVGKSSLINAITGQELATVSHLAHKDGTEGVTRFRDPTDLALEHIDLPGLDSRNFPTQVTERIQNMCPNAKLLPVLVINSQAGRLTTFLDAFERIKNDLVGRDASFAIVYTRRGVISAENERHMKITYPHATVFRDDQIELIRTFLNNPDLFRTQIKTAVREMAAQRAAAAAAAAPRIAPVTRTVIAPAPAAPKVLTFKLVPPLNEGFQNSHKRPESLEDLINQVLEVKRYNGTGAVQHVNADLAKKLTADTYKQLKYLGDRTLGMLAPRILYAGGERDELRIKTDLITNNAPNCAMQRFFKKYVRTAHSQAFPSEVSVISAHDEVDFVEALLEVAMSYGKKGRVFKFMIVEFFTSVGLGKFVGK